MSVRGQSLPKSTIRVISAYPSTAEVQRTPPLVQFVPTGDSCTAAKLRRYSMTSSAWVSSDCGTVRPSALAVLRLITRSNLVGACGQVGGFLALEDTNRL